MGPLRTPPSSTKQASRRASGKLEMDKLRQEHCASNDAPGRVSTPPDPVIYGVKEPDDHS